MSEPEQIEAIRRRLAAEPMPEPPPELVERWHAALAELPPPRPREMRLARRPTRWIVAAASVAAAAAVLVTVPGSNPTRPAPHDSPAPLTLDTRDARDIGELADPVRLAGCLTRVGAPGAMVLDGRRIERQGRVGVRLVLPGEAPGRYRILVVTEDCGLNAGRLLSDGTG